MLAAGFLVGIPFGMGALWWMVRDDLVAAEARAAAAERDRDEAVMKAWTREVQGGAT